MNNQMRLLARELLAEELSELGTVLDSAESKRVKLSPDKYMKAAKAAAHIVGKYPRCPLILEAVATSPALRELRSNVAMREAINIGLCDLPDEVLRCLSCFPLGMLGMDAPLT